MSKMVSTILNVTNAFYIFHTCRHTCDKPISNCARFSFNLLSSNLKWTQPCFFLINPQWVRSRGVDSSHATWTRVGLESLFLWLVTWLGLAKKWLATWLGLARKWLVTNASQNLLERPRDLIIFLNSPRPKKVCFRFNPLQLVFHCLPSC